MTTRLFVSDSGILFSSFKKVADKVFLSSDDFVSVKGISYVRVDDDDYGLFISLSGARKFFKDCGKKTTVLKGRDIAGDDDDSMLIDVMVLVIDD